MTLDESSRSWSGPIRWCLVLCLVGSCRSPEYIDVPRAGGGTVRVVKARVPWFKKLDVPFGRYFLLRRNAEFAAVRLGERTGGGALWDCSYQGDGSGDLRRGAVAHGEVFEHYAATETAGIYSTAGSQANIACGPLVVGWSIGNWLYPRGLWSGDDLDSHQHDPGVEVAVTSATELGHVDVFDSELDWLAPW
jgi:hypothetical protein